MINQSTVASLQKGAARIDGKFWVTENSVNFESYNKQMILGPYHLERNAIANVKQITGKGAGIIPTTSEAIRISMKDGSSYEFILSGAKDWAKKINPI